VQPHNAQTFQHIGDGIGLIRTVDGQIELSIRTQPIAGQQAEVLRVQGTLRSHRVLPPAWRPVDTVGANVAIRRNTTGQPQRGQTQITCPFHAQAKPGAFRRGAGSDRIRIAHDPQKDAARSA
jgi:hypothetical protein